MLEKTLVFEKELSDINFERLKNALVYIKNNLIDSDDNMYLTVDSLIDMNNVITGSNNIIPRKVNVKLCGYNEMCMGKDFIDDKLYQLVDQFNERKINHRDFYSALLDNINPFYDGKGITCKILFVSSFL